MPGTQALNLPSSPKLERTRGSSISLKQMGDSIVREEGYQIFLDGILREVKEGGLEINYSQIYQMADNMKQVSKKRYGSIGPNTSPDLDANFIAASKSPNFPKLLAASKHLGE